MRPIPLYLALLLLAPATSSLAAASIGSRTYYLQADGALFSESEPTRSDPAGLMTNFEHVNGVPYSGNTGILAAPLRIARDSPLHLHLAERVRYTSDPLTASVALWVRDADGAEVKGADGSPYILASARVTTRGEILDNAPQPGWSDILFLAGAPGPLPHDNATITVPAGYRIFMNVSLVDTFDPGPAGALDGFGLLPASSWRYGSVEAPSSLTIPTAG